MARTAVLPHRRSLFLVPLAALVVHQLRYLLAFGSGATHELAAQGHAYLNSVTPWIILVAAVGFGGFLRRLAGASALSERHRAHPYRRTLHLWAVAAVGLLVIYVGQEALEALLAPGHPGVAGIVASGGWWAVPAAVAVGGFVAHLLRGAQAILAWVTRQRGPRRAELRAAAQPLRAYFPRLRPLAVGEAGRAPPVARAVAL
jgi:hypothetical protein